MNFRDTPEEAAFRQEVQRFIQTNAPAGRVSAAEGNPVCIKLVEGDLVQTGKGGHFGHGGKPSMFTSPPNPKEKGLIGPFPIRF